VGGLLWLCVVEMGWLTHAGCAWRRDAGRFVGANRVFKTVPWGKVSREQREKERTPKQAQKRVTTLTKKDDARRAKIQAAGMDYEFDGYAALVPAKRTKTRF
jgi:nucleolar protein 15